MNRILSFKKILIVIFGSSIMGIGIALALSTSLGADPLAWVWVGISTTFPISLLQSNLLIAVLMLIPPLIFDRSQLGIGTIIQPIVVGIANEQCLKILPNNEHNIVILLLGLVILGIGVGIYTSADFGKNSYDSCIFLINKKTKISVGLLRSAGDMILCVLGLFLNKQLLVGPIIAIIIIGPVMNYTLKRINMNVT
ncbi:hypothetical protein CSC2_07390 [Clostridium zeae]|uniref:YitT family protein n=1 Tax=Clostridium zeae TaxID=2759022 RepID=A0ABQ1E6T5_9CLOT|nr:YitT family protein [Clostridium zeae]GFZ30213.1 hypothetical protein CSC2_07390 [Clostridium zeae]